MAAIAELEEAYRKAGRDRGFQGRLDDLLENYVGRPTPLYPARRLSAHLGGARIWLKREDLCHTGAHKINNALGQGLLAREMGKGRVIAETGAGQHGVAVATSAALLGLECRVYMGEEDMRRQELNVVRMRLMGAEVVGVDAGSRTLKDAINEALRDWVTNVRTTHYILGSVLGPHPYPMMVRDFQTVIGREALAQFKKAERRLPDLVVACVGGGSNAAGIFTAFVPHEAVGLVGVEAGGRGPLAGDHAARFTETGAPGVLHGTRTRLLQDADGQVLDTHSISAGLDYPGRRPRARSVAGERPRHLYQCQRRRSSGRISSSCRDRGHHSGTRVGTRSGLRCQSRALDAARFPRADKSLGARRQGSLGSQPGRWRCPVSRLGEAFREAKRCKRAAFVPYITAGDPNLESTVGLVRALAHAGADVIELGVPFSDPMADGPTNQRAAERALESGTTLSGVLATVEVIRKDLEIPIVLFTYANPVLRFGLEAFAEDASTAGIDGVLFTDVPAEEMATFETVLSQSGLDLVMLVTPTSDKSRMKAAARYGGGFLYLVSRTGVTGAKEDLAAELQTNVRLARSASRLPVAVGFGISTPEQVARVATMADGVVVGSAIVSRIGALGECDELTDEIESFARTLAEACRR